MEPPGSQVSRWTWRRRIRLRKMSLLAAKRKGVPWKSTATTWSCLHPVFLFVWFLVGSLVELLSLWKTPCLLENLVSLSLSALHIAFLSRPQAKASIHSCFQRTPDPQPSSLPPAWATLPPPIISPGRRWRESQQCHWWGNSWRTPATGTAATQSCPSAAGSSCPQAFLTLLPLERAGGSCPFLALSPATFQESRWLLLQTKHRTLTW